MERVGTVAVGDIIASQFDSGHWIGVIEVVAMCIFYPVGGQNLIYCPLSLIITYYDSDRLKDIECTLVLFAKPSFDGTGRGRDSRIRGRICFLVSVGIYWIFKEETSLHVNTLSNSAGGPSQPTYTSFLSRKHHA